MRKILIISYFYPPCNLTASQRVKGWADYLQEFGFYPIVVTRNWDITIKSSEDVLKSSGDAIRVEKNQTHEVHYLPYKASIRDRVYTLLKGTKFQKLSKVFTFLQLVLENFSIRFIPHNSLFHYSSKLLSSDPSISTLIISANPFDQFSFGYHLKKKHNIRWIADYRDDWNTSELEKHSPSFINALQTKSEKKWVGSADLITSVSEHYVNKIKQFVNCSGVVILNGYDLQLLNRSSKTLPDIFRITYNGSLYKSQPIEIFIKALKELILNNRFTVKIEIHFPGLAFDKVQEERILSLTTEIKDHVHIYPRLAKEDVIELQLSSDLLLMVTHQNLKGVPSSKLFEYFGLKKPILVVPGDNDIVDEYVSNTKSGFITYDISGTVKILQELIELKSKGEELLEFKNDDLLKSFSRKNQTKQLAEILNEIQ